ncbi:hypothetical protein PENNAL_c0010G00343 [Penicillium nalgiovense]|uniref:Uncharacterized protein n=1 Tax=Penicillium nalgiovense TaxID=60175 RepID=A0A1V6YUV9_PENNA|nr:hypothetical protein PENNAL_c0010G00343 [Penicillium nalgiovense]
MDSSNQSSPQQASTPNTGTSSTSNAAVANSSTLTSSNYTYPEQKLSDDEEFQRNTNYMGGWIQNLNHPDQFSLSKS